MSKQPQGVYVNEEVHNRVSTLVENALDGHGTLAGFVAFLEEALYDAANEPAWEELEETEGQMERFDAAPADSLAQAPELAEYERAWRELCAALPWQEPDSDGRAHALALYALLPRKHLWQFDGVYDAARDDVGKRTLLELVDALQFDGDVGSGNRASSTRGNHRYDQPFPLLWRDKGLEVILDEVKSRSTSFYLESEPHRFTLNVFGRGLFDRIARAFDRLLNLEEHWLPLEHEFRFLEHGLALFGYQELHWGEVEAADFKQRRARLKARDSSGDRLPRERLFRELFGWSWDRNYSAVPVPGHAVGTDRNVLSLAYKLGVVDLGVPIDAAELKVPLLAAFLQAYGLQRLAPERRLAYKVIASQLIDTGVSYVTNAVDYHLMRLLQAYALSVLPVSDQQPARVHPATLATLAQPWVFPTRATLTTYGAIRAGKAEAGDWELHRGRSAAPGMSDASAYWTAEALNAVFPVPPGLTRNPRAIAKAHQEAINLWLIEPGFDDAHDPMVAVGSATNPEAWADALQVVQPNKGRLTLPLGLETVERAHSRIEAALEGKLPLDPVGIGLVVIAELTDEQLKAHGAFTRAFLRNSEHDTTPVLLQPEHRLALTILAGKARGHAPTEFSRVATPDGNGAWSYSFNGEDQVLGNDLGDCMRLLAEEYAGVGETPRAFFLGLAHFSLDEDPDRLRSLYGNSIGGPHSHLFDNDRYFEAARLYGLASRGSVDEVGALI